MNDPVQPPPLPETDASTGAWFVLTRAERRSAGLAALGILGVFAVAAILTPDSRGLGTHQQLGLPPCMTETVLGVPCPFCGMTTSFTHMAHGQVVEAVMVQPAGALGFVIAAALALGFGTAVASGAAPTKWREICRSRRVFVAGGVTLGLAWIYKILVHTGVVSF